jgi:isopentenyl diphosphate isomerase/L-lactate dehydrogenase-like FMN-dependent dehydrogenase
VLEEVIDSIKGKIEVYVDGGFRTGADVLKALCLGAKGVFLGRPALWALSYNVRYGSYTQFIGAP